MITHKHKEVKMYILTEEKQSINLSERERVQTQHGSHPKYENRNKYGSPYVKPWKNENDSFDGKWALCINVLEPSDERSVICVAVFDTVYLANLALSSVNGALKSQAGWDAEAYKNKAD